MLCRMGGGHEGLSGGEVQGRLEQALGSSLAQHSPLINRVLCDHSTETAFRRKRSAELSAKEYRKLVACVREYMDKSSRQGLDVDKLSGKEVQRQLEKVLRCDLAPHGQLIREATLCMQEERQQVKEHGLVLGVFPWLSVHDRQYLDNLFHQHATKGADIDVPRKLQGDAAVRLLMNTFGVPVETLYQIWGLADPGDRGYLSLPGFYFCMRLVSMARAGYPITRSALHSLRNKLLPVPTNGPPVTAKAAKKLGGNDTNSNADRQSPSLLQSQLVASNSAALAKAQSNRGSMANLQRCVNCGAPNTLACRRCKTCGVLTLIGMVARPPKVDRVAMQRQLDAIGHGASVNFSTGMVFM